MPAFIGIFTVGFLTGLSGALMPGPLLAFTVTSAAKRGSWVGAFVVAGHAIFECTLVALIFVGAATFLTNDTAVRVVGAIGAAVLAAMGAMMLRDVPRLSLAEAVSGASKPSGTFNIEHPLLGGVVLTALNPTFPLWWAGPGLGLVSQYGRTLENVSYLYAGHISSDLLWYVTVSMIIGHGRQFVSDRIYRIFIGACAAFLIAFAGYFAYGAITGHKADKPSAHPLSAPVPAAQAPPSMSTDSF